MSALNDDTVLVGDLRTGTVYGFNVIRDAYYVASTDHLLAPAPNPTFGPVGVNGLHVRQNFLYFANSGQNGFGRFPIEANVTQAGNSSVIARPLETYQGYDDFTYDKEGNFYLVTGTGNSVMEVTHGGQRRIIAGSVNSTYIAQGTSASMGRGPAGKNTPVHGDSR
ncbi:MAG: hypothetical protein LQ340_005013 [Diploschistes diacapsis]|nr:MAG: hypothetical protein LQ340_005013 [Diploschistes diacapsis]